jgi:hypothetical protein
MLVTVLYGMLLRVSEVVRDPFNAGGSVGRR